MSEQRTNRKLWSTSTDPALYEQLKKLSEALRVPTSRMLDEAIQDLLNKYGVSDKENIDNIFEEFLKYMQDKNKAAKGKK